MRQRAMPIYRFSKKIELIGETLVQADEIETPSRRAVAKYANIDEKTFRPYVLALT